MEESPTKRRVEIHSSRSVRLIFFCLGTAFVVGAVAGVVLPVLPTTPLLLVAAACYARSSDRFYGALLGNRIFGPIIDDWHINHCISKRVKATAIFMIAVTIGFSATMVVKHPYLKIMLVVIALGVIGFILSFPSTPKGAPPAD